MTALAIPRPTQPTLTSASVVARYHLRWLGVMWAIGLVCWLAVMALDVRYGAPVESIWRTMIAGWQMWAVLGAGVATVPWLLPMTVTMGATRRQWADGAVAGMAALAAAATAFIVGGYALEAHLYDIGGWEHTFPDGFTVEGPWDLAQLAAETFPVQFAYLLSGWLIGLMFYRGGARVGVPAVLPCFVPAALCSWLIGLRDGGPGAGAIPLAVALPLAVVALAATVALGRRLAVGTRIRPR